MWILHIYICFDVNVPHFIYSEWNPVSTFPFQCFYPWPINLSSICFTLAIFSPLNSVSLFKFFQMCLVLFHVLKVLFDMHECKCYAWCCPHMPEEGNGYPETGVTDGHKALCRSWEWKPFQKSQVFLACESSFFNLTETTQCC